MAVRVAVVMAVVEMAEEAMVVAEKEVEMVAAVRAAVEMVEARAAVVVGAAVVGAAARVTVARAEEEMVVEERKAEVVHMEALVAEMEGTEEEKMVARMAVVMVEAAMAVVMVAETVVAISRRNDRSSLTVMRADQTPSPRSVLETQAPRHLGRYQPSILLGLDSYSRACPAHL